jgi:hypothetical protein
MEKRNIEEIRWGGCLIKLVQWMRDWIWIESLSTRICWNVQWAELVLVYCHSVHKIYDGGYLVRNCAVRVWWRPFNTHCHNFGSALLTLVQACRHIAVLFYLNELLAYPGHQSRYVSVSDTILSKTLNKYLSYFLLITYIFTLTV